MQAVLPPGSSQVPPQEDALTLRLATALRHDMGLAKDVARLFAIRWPLWMAADAIDQAFLAGVDAADEVQVDTQLPLGRTVIGTAPNQETVAAKRVDLSLVGRKNDTALWQLLVEVKLESQFDAPNQGGVVYQPSLYAVMWNERDPKHEAKLRRIGTLTRDLCHDDAWIAEAKLAAPHVEIASASPRWLEVELLIEDALARLKAGCLAGSEPALSELLRMLRRWSRPVWPESSKDIVKSDSPLLDLQMELVGVAVEQNLVRSLLNVRRQEPLLALGHGSLDQTIATVAQINESLGSYGRRRRRKVLARWAPEVAVPDREMTAALEAAGLTELEARVIVMRTGWGGEAPRTPQEVQLKVGCMGDAAALQESAIKKLDEHFS